jgi:phosphoribosylaminoimidazole-succinocarboxamide synthase
MLTPTTKEEHHDRPISPSEIVSEGWMTQENWDYCSQKALELFSFGQKKAAENGMILVDTKYEMGKDSDGNIVLIDEIHTPDSSRYWIAESYDKRMAMGDEPQNIDKEFLRLWFVDNCDPYNDEIVPDAPEELVTELSSRYIYLYETITGGLFPFPKSGKSVHVRINKNLKDVL